jgi:outer membrane protein
MLSQPVFQLKQSLRMTTRIAVVVFAAVLLFAGQARAEDEAPAQAPSLSDVKLLDDAPNLAAALRDQWTGSDVPVAFENLENDTQFYGRLRDSGAPQPMSLQQAVGLALMNNTGLQIQRLVPLGARAGVMQAQSIFDPAFFGDTGIDRTTRPATSILQGASITETNNFPWNFGLRKTLTTGGQFAVSWRNTRANTNSTFFDLLPYYTTELGMSLNQPLLRDFGYRFTTLLVRIARNTQDQATYQYEAAISTTVQQVETAYWNLVLATEAVRVQEQGLSLSRELERQNEGKFKVGALPQTSVLEAQAEVARREAELIRVKNAFINARDTLRALVNYRPPGSDELLIIEASDSPTVDERDFDLDRSLAAALARRPELAAAKLDVRGRGMMLKVAENQLLPRFNATGALGTNGVSGRDVPSCSIVGVPVEDCIAMGGNLNPNQFAGPYGDAVERLADGRFYSYAAGVTIEIPLDNAQAKADYARSRIDLESSQRQLQQQQEQVTLDIKKAVTTLQSDVQSIQATRIARELSEENLRNQQARYDVGLATTKDILDFQDQLTQARFAEVNALTRYRTDLAELQRAEGTLLEHRNIVLDRGEQEETPWYAYF